MRIFPVLILAALTLAPIACDDTERALANFKQVTPGMKPTEVEAIMGNPNAIVTDDSPDPAARPFVYVWNTTGGDIGITFLYGRVVSVELSHGPENAQPVQ